MSEQLSLWNNPEIGASHTQTTHSESLSRQTGGPADSNIDVLSTLQKQIQKMETAGRRQLQPISSGIDALDQLLPGAGFPPGSLIEWISTCRSSCAGMLALQGAQAAHQQSGGKIVVFDSQQTFYPPAALACGLPAEAIILLRPTSRQDALWAIDQSLRSSAVAAVWGHLPSLGDSDARRLQLAAETGGTLGLFTRPAKAIHDPSWAEIRLQVKPLAIAKHQQDRASHRRIHIRLLRVVHGKAGQQIVLAMDSNTGTIIKEPQRVSTSAQRLAAELARPAATGHQHAHRA